MFNALAIAIGNIYAAPAAGGGGGGVGGETKIGKISPNPTGLPGSKQAEGITSGIMYFSLLFCLVGLILSAGLWAVGAFSNNYTQSVNGKKGFLICAGAALAIGCAWFLIGWFFHIGGTITS